MLACQQELEAKANKQKLAVRKHGQAESISSRTTRGVSEATTVCSGDLDQASATRPQPSIAGSEQQPSQSQPITQLTEDPRMRQDLMSMVRTLEHTQISLLTSSQLEPSRTSQSLGDTQALVPPSQQEASRQTLPEQGNLGRARPPPQISQNKLADIISAQEVLKLNAKTRHDNRRLKMQRQRGLQHKNNPSGGAGDGAVVDCLCHIWLEEGHMVSFLLLSTFSNDYSVCDAGKYSQRIVTAGHPALIKSTEPVCS